MAVATSTHDKIVHDGPLAKNTISINSLTANQRTRGLSVFRLDDRIGHGHPDGQEPVFYHLNEHSPEKVLRAYFDANQHLLDHHTEDELTRAINNHGSQYGAAWNQLRENLFGNDDDADRTPEPPNWEVAHKLDGVENPRAVFATRDDAEQHVQNRWGDTPEETDGDDELYRRHIDDGRLETVTVRPTDSRNVYCVINEAGDEVLREFLTEDRAEEWIDMRLNPRGTWLEDRYSDKKLREWGMEVRNATIELATPEMFPEERTDGFVINE